MIETYTNYKLQESHFYNTAQKHVYCHGWLPLQVFYIQNDSW